MSDINRLIERQDRILKRSEDATVKRILEILGQSYFEMERILSQRWISFSRESMPNLLPDQRRLLLLNELQNLLPLIDPQAFDGINQEFVKTLQIADQNGITMAEELIKVLDSDSFVTRTATLPLEQIAIAAENTTQRLQATGYKFSNEASTVIGMGISQGWGARKTATALRQRFGVAKQYAEAEARTSILQAGNEASKRVYADNGIEYIQDWETLDSRTCPYCVARNMRVYRIEDAMIPWHYQCRGKAVPWKESWQRAGLTDDEWAKSFRAKTMEQLDGNPNYGLTPFEKKAGITEVPKHVWSP